MRRVSFSESLQKRQMKKSFCRLYTDLMQKDADHFLEDFPITVEKVSSEPRTSTQVRCCPGLSGTTRDSLKRANEEVLRETPGVLRLSLPVTTWVRAVLRKNDFKASYLFFCIISGLSHFVPCLLGQCSLSETLSS